jgi:hypothetical protein
VYALTWTLDVFGGRIRSKKMPMYIVLVKCGGYQYPDSFWVEENKANERVEFLTDRFRHADSVSPRFVAWVSKAKIEDAVLGGNK